MIPVPHYEEVFSVRCELSTLAILEAMDRLGIVRPALIIHPIDEPRAQIIAARMPISITTSDALSPGEWYLESENGRVGSIGC